MGGKSSKSDQPKQQKSLQNNKNQQKVNEPKTQAKQVVKQQIVKGKQEPKQQNKQISFKQQTQNKGQTGIKPTIQKIGQFVLCFGRSIYGVKSSIKESQAFISYLKRKQKINKQYGIPMKNFYQNLPQKISDAKLFVIKHHTFNQRFAAVNLIALGTALVTIRKYPNYQLINHSLTAFRNAGIAYLTSGIFITPEIYNPLFKDK